MSNKGDANFISYAGNVENYYKMEILSDRMEAGARRGLISCGEKITKITKDNIKNPPKSGKKYKRLRVRSSAKGEFPANQTGKLRRNVGYQVQGTRRLFVGVHSPAFYAQFLAFGTRNMSKRAFIGNVIRDNVKTMYDTLTSTINKEIGI